MASKTCQGQGVIMETWVTIINGKQFDHVLLKLFIIQIPATNSNGPGLLSLFPEYWTRALQQCLVQLSVTCLFVGADHNHGSETHSKSGASYAVFIGSPRHIFARQTSHNTRLRNVKVTFHFVLSAIFCI